MYKGNEGKCFGKWDIKDLACSRCLMFVRAKCERLTKRMKAEIEGEMDDKAMSEAEKRNDLNEYLLGVMQVKFGVPKSHWEGAEDSKDQMATHFYYDSEGNLLAFVACRMSTGMIKVSSQKVVGGKVVSLESTEQVDALVKELAG